MSLKLTILGCNSAIPTISRFTTSQFLTCNQSSYLIDCGEGVQMRIRSLKLKPSRLKVIFISHLHGDHYFGLPGLLTSFNLAGRKNKLKVFGPKGLKKFVSILTEIGSLYLDFPIEIHEIEADHHEKIYQDNDIHVYSIPLKHRIPTTGFLFREAKKERNIRTEFISSFELSIEEIKLLKQGKNIERGNGEFLSYAELTKPPKNSASYAFCSDTIYDEEIIPFIKNVDLLYHEATYLHDLHEKARQRGHSTAKEAAIIAKKSKAGRLVLGHYSSRYRDLYMFQKEAAEVFQDVILAEDGLTLEI